MDSDRLTVKEAALRLRLSAASVYALCAAGMLRHQRVGVGRGKLLIPLDAIEEYHARTTVDSTGGEPAAHAPDKHKGLKPFANLNPDRLLAAWKKQGRA